MRMIFKETKIRTTNCISGHNNLLVCMRCALFTYTRILCSTIHLHTPSYPPHPFGPRWCGRPKTFQSPEHSARSCVANVKKFVFQLSPRPKGDARSRTYASDVGHTHTIIIYPLPLLDAECVTRLGNKPAAGRQCERYRRRLCIKLSTRWCAMLGNQFRTEWVASCVLTRACLCIISEHLHNRFVRREC